MGALTAAGGADDAVTATDFGVGPQARAAAGQRTCIVVLGMHRSGTSALTRVLSLLGAALPEHLLGAAPSNATGHWEPLKLVVFHDELLAGLHSAWDDWTAIDLSQLTAQRHDLIKNQIADIINDDYGGAPLMVVKDPRICRFAPLFLEARTDAGITPECVLTFRNPLEVAQSLERRNCMTRGDAGLLWLRHVLDAEAATRGSRRAILFYSDLLADWRGEIHRIRIGAGPCTAPDAEPGPEARPDRVWPDPTEEVCEQIDGFLSAEQRHHARSAADLMRDPFMSGWTAEVYDALHQLRQQPASAAAFAALDRVRGEFDRAVPLISRMQRDLRARVEAEQAERRTAELDASARQIAALASRLVAARAVAEAAVERLGAASRSAGGTAAGHGEPAARPASIADIADVAQWLEGLAGPLSSASRWRRLIAPLRKARAALRKIARPGFCRASTVARPDDGRT
jgi:hypothetical protein